MIVQLTYLLTSDGHYILIFMDVMDVKGFLIKFDPRAGCELQKFKIKSDTCGCVACTCWYVCGEVV